MATYKVIQDIEAEDKILGPLTLRQFIYALVCVFFLYLSFIVVAKGVPFLLAAFLPPALFTGFFAFPFGRDQPTEVWAIAKIGFLLKPRRRIWDQSGVKELVTITVPKKIERVYTNGLSQTEVKSRLSALATTIDSRGWAIKNINVNLYGQPGLLSDDSSDRLVAMSSMPQSVPDYAVEPSDDILDENNNPIAQQFTEMITASTQAHRQHLIDTMNGVHNSQSTTTTTVDSNMWFTPVEPQVLEPATPFAPVAPEPATPTADELTLLDKIRTENSTTQTYTSHMHTLQPLSAQAPTAPITQMEEVKVMEPASVAVPQTDPSLQYLARNNDRSIDSLAREANRAKVIEDSSQGEVIISLR